MFSSPATQECTSRICMRSLAGTCQRRRRRSADSSRPRVSRSCAGVCIPSIGGSGRVRVRLSWRVLRTPHKPLRFSGCFLRATPTHFSCFTPAPSLCSASSRSSLPGLSPHPSVHHFRHAQISREDSSVNGAASAKTVKAGHSARRGRLARRKRALTASKPPYISTVERDRQTPLSHENAPYHNLDISA